MNIAWIAAGAAALAVIIWVAARFSGKEKGPTQSKSELQVIGMNPGADGVPVMYTLATCRHCVHLKDFLTKHGIAHHVVFVDKFSGNDRKEMMAVLRAHNPRGSFPTLVLPGGQTIAGFREGEVRSAFGLPAQD